LAADRQSRSVVAYGFGTETGFGEGSFDALLCVDSMNHLHERAAVLGEWHRLVRPGGRILFTDPITVTGLLRRDEMIVRSSAMGGFFFTPPGLDEHLIREAALLTCGSTT
jgi:SAM-dependent methyltransferase